MNSNSEICILIQENPDSWRDIIKDNDIKVKQEDNLAIFNYLPGADFSQKIVQEARGIIIDLNTLDVVCWPFNKFHNQISELADEIDWESAVVQEKLDGSIIKLWNYRDEWRWSTNSCINAADAHIKGLTNTDYQKLIDWCPDKQDALKIATNKNLTYIFELTSPWNRIVIPYKKTELTLIGIKDRNTGLELSVSDVKYKTPKIYKEINSLSECEDLARNLNAEEEIQHEGFVVKDKFYKRIKVKTPEYLKLHHLISTETPEQIISCLLNQDESVEYLKKSSLGPKFTFYEKALDEFTKKLQKELDDARAFYKTCDRKTFAESVKENPYCGFLFTGIDYPELTAKELLQKTSPKFLLKFLPEPF